MPRCHWENAAVHDNDTHCPRKMALEHRRGPAGLACDSPAFYHVGQCGGASERRSPRALRASIKTACVPRSEPTMYHERPGPAVLIAVLRPASRAGDGDRWGCWGGHVCYSLSHLRGRTTLARSLITSMAPISAENPVSQTCLTRTGSPKPLENVLRSVLTGPLDLVAAWARTRLHAPAHHATSNCRWPYSSSFASMLISAFSSREMGQPALASLAAVSNLAWSAPGILAVTFRWTRVTVQPRSSFSRVTSAPV